MSDKKFTLPSRIRKRKHFLLASNNGRKYVSAGLICQAIENQKDVLQVGFTTTKKLGSAVVRNKIRRRMREVVRLFFAPEAPKGYNYVFIGRFNTATRSFEALKKDTLYLLRAVQADYEQRLSVTTRENDADCQHLSDEVLKNIEQWNVCSCLVSDEITEKAEQNHFSAREVALTEKTEQNGLQFYLSKNNSDAGE